VGGEFIVKRRWVAGTGHGSRTASGNYSSEQFTELFWRSRIGDSATESSVNTVPVVVFLELQQFPSEIPGIPKGRVIEILPVARKNSIGVAKQPIGTHDATRPGQVSR